MPPKKKEEAKLVVASADSMLMLDFIRHTRIRHPRIGFRTKGEHAADHRLHPDHLDHTHDDMIPQKEEGNAKTED